MCCAGIGWAERVAGKRGPHALEPFETVIRVNLIGTFNVLRLAAAAMLAERAGRSRRARRVHQHRVDRRLRRPDRPDLLLGLQGRDRRDDASRPPGISRASAIRVCTIAPGTFDTPLLGALPEPAREALAAAIPYPSRLGRPDEYAALAAHIVENEMLNGEMIRLDGALRMPPK